jgi:hypothetical protein
MVVGGISSAVIVPGETLFGGNAGAVLVSGYGAVVVFDDHLF